MNSEEPTRQERREARQEAKAKFRADNRRSIRLIALLGVKQKPKRRRK